MTALPAFPLFGPLSAEDNDALAPLLRPRRYEAERLISQRGDPAEEVFRMSAGQLRVSVCSPDGRELAFRAALPGDMVGEIGVLADSVRGASGQYIILTVPRGTVPLAAGCSYAPATWRESRRHGAVYFDGLDARQLDPAPLRRQIGYVGQDSRLAPGSILDNILDGRRAGHQRHERPRGWPGSRAT